MKRPTFFTRKRYSRAGQGNTHAHNALARLVKHLGEKTELAFPMHIRDTELTLTRCKDFLEGGQHG